MSKLEDMSLEEFEATLDSGQHVRTQQILHIALGFGPVAFAGVIGYLYRNQDPVTEPGTESVLTVLSFAHVAVAFSAWIAAFLVPGFLLNPKRLDRLISQPMQSPRGYAGGTITDPREILLALFTQAHVLRMALLEGPALFGLVVCLLGVLGGELREQPIYWLNAATTVVLVLALALTFPSRDKLVELFRRKKEEASIAF